MWKELKIPILLYCTLLVVIIGIHVVCSWQESRVFNKLTGAKTTTVDAIFVQLRVVEPFKVGYTHD